MIPRQRQPVEPPAPGLLDLFGGQDVPPVKVAPPADAWGAAEANVQWLRPLAGRPLCDHCTQAIHASKGGGHPLVASARRKGPNGQLHLCPEHALLQRELDDKAEAARKAREAATKGGSFWAKPKARRQREHA